MIRIKNPKNSGMSPIFPKGEKYLIIDWANFVRRAYHSTDRSKVLELIVFMLAKLKREYPEHQLVFALEGRGSAIRTGIFPGYKANREPDPTFDASAREALQLLSFVRGTVIKAPEGEADDAIACFVQRMEKGSNALIISEDRDLWQLIRGESVRVSVRKGGLINAYKCKEILGVPPENVACLKALLGDSDNIPRGVPRMRTVLLTEFALHGITPGKAYQNAKAKGALTEKELARVVKYKEQIDLNYKLIRLRGNLKLLTKTQNGNPTAFMKFLADHQLYRVSVQAINRLTKEGPVTDEDQS
jgi:5'-3' exonuclease